MSILFKLSLQIIVILLLMVWNIKNRILDICYSLAASVYSTVSMTIVLRLVLFSWPGPCQTLCDCAAGDVEFTRSVFVVFFFFVEVGRGEQKASHWARSRQKRAQTPRGSCGVSEDPCLQFLPSQQGRGMARLTHASPVVSLSPGACLTPLGLSPTSSQHSAIPVCPLTPALLTSYCHLAPTPIIYLFLTLTQERESRYVPQRERFSLALTLLFGLDSV